MNIIECIANELHCKTDTIVTISVPIFVFIIGLFINYLSSRIKLSNERKQYRKYFTSLIKNVMDYTPKQRIEFDKIIHSLSMKCNNEIRFAQITENSLNLVNKLSFDKLFDSYFNGYSFQKNIKEGHLILFLIKLNLLDVLILALVIPFLN
jgi:hypothetical protein